MGAAWGSAPHWALSAHDTPCWARTLALQLGVKAAGKVEGLVLSQIISVHGQCHRREASGVYIRIGENDPKMTLT